MNFLPRCAAQLAQLAAARPRFGDRGPKARAARRQGAAAATGQTGVMASNRAPFARFGSFGKSAAREHRLGRAQAI